MKIYTFASIFLILYLGCAKADPVSDFLQAERVKTYDCPTSDMVPQLELFLSDTSLSPQTMHALNVQKAHWLICVGDFIKAQNLLNAVLNSDTIDKTSYAYASAIYQLGFIFDVKENPQRCTYYKQAEILGNKTFDDIALSSQLGLITVCGDDSNDMTKRFAKLYSLLERYLQGNHPEEVAHIHNNLGLLFGDIGQNALAVEQYEKAYEIGLKVYEEKNQLAPLMSLISALVGSGSFERAKEMTEHLRQSNYAVNTPLSNSWLHFAESRNNYLSKDYEALRGSLRSWNAFREQVSNETLNDIFTWYSASLCLQDADRSCVESFVKQTAQNIIPHSTRLKKNHHYLYFLVKATLYLQDIDAASEYFERYAEITTAKITTQQASGKVLGVANLYSEISELETNLAEEQRQRYQIFIAIFAGLLILFVLLYIFIGRPYLARIHRDPMTGLLNENAVLTAIKRVPRPIGGKTNALALFDLRNFTSVNSEFGHMTGSLALKSVAACLKHVTREQDIVGRVSHDQFIVCLKNIEEVMATAFFTRIQQALESTEFNTGEGDRVSIDSSMNIYICADKFYDLDEVLMDMRDSFKAQH